VRLLGGILAIAVGVLLVGACCGVRNSDVGLVVALVLAEALLPGAAKPRGAGV